MQFTEHSLELSIIELFENEGYTHQTGQDIHRGKSWFAIYHTHFLGALRGIPARRGSVRPQSGLERGGDIPLLIYEETKWQIIKLVKL